MARYPKAVWNPSPNKSIGGMTDYHLFAFHIEQGSEAGTVAWFNNPRSRVSAHFSIGKDGAVHQHVDTKDKAWAECNGNPHTISCEFEGRSGESLTSQQLAAVSALLAWCHKTHGLRLAVTDDAVRGEGVIGHSFGGQAWGGHDQCPGNPILRQRVGAVATAIALSSPPVKVIQPPKPAPGVPGKGDWFKRVLTLSTPMLHGSDVEHVQMVIGTHTDGWYGKDTKAQVVAWQRRHGLDDDGVVGPKTAKAMG